MSGSEDGQLQSPGNDNFGLRCVFYVLKNHGKLLALSIYILWGELKGNHIVCITRAFSHGYTYGIYGMKGTENKFPWNNIYALLFEDC